MSTNVSSDHDVVVVLLGASNLARAHHAFVNHLRKQIWQHHVEFMSVMGPGRAYCVEGGMLHVRYPAIVSCGVIEALRQRAQSSCRIIALVTDIGNDIMYGVPAKEIIRCLDRLFDELRAFNAYVIVTMIHVDLENAVGHFYFLLLRTLLFPRSSVTYHEAAMAIRRINSFLEKREGETFHVVKDMKRYTGGDKIHYSLFKSHIVWTRLSTEILGCLKLAPCRRIDWVRIVKSLLINVIRVLFTDIMPIWKRRKDIF